MGEPDWLLVNTGSRNCKLTQMAPDGTVRQRWLLEGKALLEPPADWLARLGVPLALTAHRLVHGGPELSSPAWWSPALDEALAPLDALAPLHNPPARRWASACAGLWPDARHCLIPDTGFFTALPPLARTLPLPSHLRDCLHLYHYGFHGLAHASLWRQLAACDPASARGRVITLQLGGGCSAAALRNGVPVDTSMSFSPLAGLVMATRPGDLDPGVLLHLLKSGLAIDELEHLLYHESGLKGLSDQSGDMRTLLAAHSRAASLAVEQFCYRIGQYIGAYAVSLGGLDAVVFGGGIGENAASIREQVCSRLALLGIALDGRANASATGSTCISHASSRVAAWVLPSDEETEMQRLTQHLLKRT